MMPKPIFMFGIPKELFDETTDSILKSASSKMQDYHFIAYATNEEECQFKAFYEKDFDEVKFEEIKQFIKDQTNSK